MLVSAYTCKDLLFNGRGNLNHLFVKKSSFHTLYLIGSITESLRLHTGLYPKIQANQRGSGNFKVGIEWVIVNVIYLLCCVKEREGYQLCV